MISTLSSSGTIWPTFWTILQLGVSLRCAMRTRRKRALSKGWSTTILNLQVARWLRSSWSEDCFLWLCTKNQRNWNACSLNLSTNLLFLMCYPLPTATITPSNTCPLSTNVLSAGKPTAAPAAAFAIPRITLKNHNSPAAAIILPTAIKFCGKKGKN